MTNETNGTTETAIHCFEKAGMGKAPFKYVGLQYQEIAYGRRVIGHIGGATVTTTPGGTCEYCGTYIVEMYRIESADGMRCVVGSECVKKTGDAGLIKKVTKDAAKLRKAKTDARNANRIDLAILALADGAIRDTLMSKPHPKGWEGMNLLNWCEWMMKNAGTAGKIEVAKVLEKL